MPERKFFIAGVKFRGTEAINELIRRQVGDMLEMEKEPENKYDPNAVKLISNGTMVGYVPQRFSSEVTAMLTIGDAECQIVAINPTRPPYELCEVVVRMKKSEDEDATEEEYEDGLENMSDDNFSEFRR